MTDYFTTIILPLATTIAAILAWVAKIRWSKELQTLYAARISNAEQLWEARLANAEKQIEYHVQQAKDAIEFGPQKMREYFDAIRTIDQQHLSELKQRLDKALTEIQEREQQIEELRTDATQKYDRITRLEAALVKAKAQADFVQERLQALRQQDDDVATALDVVNRPMFDIDFVRERLRYLEIDKGWAASATRAALEAKQLAREQQQRRTMQAVRQANAKQEDATHAEQAIRRNFDE
jgi:hypothetical protein